MRIKLACATLALALISGPAFAQSGELTIWSWNIAASSLEGDRRRLQQASTPTSR